jgi:hypothetical protein
MLYTMGILLIPVFCASFLHKKRQKPVLASARYLKPALDYQCCPMRGIAVKDRPHMFNLNCAPLRCCCLQPLLGLFNPYIICTIQMPI